MFRPGDEVVCVNAGEVPVPPGCSGVRAHGGDQLIEGAVYTVTDVLVHNGEVGLRLHEARSNHPTCAYLATRFRKVQKPKTDLSIESFLTIKPGYEEPRRVTTPQRENA